jgi:hypothetical protein
LLSDLDGDHLHAIDQDVFVSDGVDDQPQNLLEQLNERCFLGLQGWENRLWQTHLRPLFDVLIGTFFLQRQPKPLGTTRGLLEALARVVDTVYADLQLATYLRSILEVDHSFSLDERHGVLAFKAGDCFTYLMPFKTCNIWHRWLDLLISRRHCCKSLLSRFNLFFHSS